MKFAVVQLGDIHIKNAGSAILTRAKAIAGAVRSACTEADAFAFVLTGDIAFSGKPEQYSAAKGFLNEIETEITRTRNKPTFVVGVPGNHDCDFESETDARPALMETIGTRLSTIDADGQIVREMIRIQEHFFDFEAAVSGRVVRPLAQRLSHHCLFETAGKRIRFNLYNTPWLSRINEQEHELLFPPQFVHPPDGEDLVISVFHHPYNWLQHENARSFRTAVENSSDIVITGHEHVDGAFVKQQLTSESSQYYVEGGALVGEDANDSTFTLLIIDTAESKYELTTFRWDKDLYRARTTEQRPFVRNKVACGAQFRNTEEFARWLEEAGHGLSHPTSRHLRLSDVFVYPDLTQGDATRRHPGNDATVHSQEVPAFLRDHPKILVIGEQESGKTAMARMFYREMREALGIVPILLNGADIQGFRHKDLRRAVRKAFAVQYDESSWEAFIQLAPERKALIVDDWDKLKYVPRGQAALIGAAIAEYGRVVCFTSDIFRVEQIADPAKEMPVFWDFEYCTIREFGRRLRGRLINKWHAVGRDFADTDTEYLYAVAASEKKIDTLIGKNLLPSYPVMLLLLLQMEDDPTATSAAGSYGHIYEALLTKRLGEVSVKPTDIGTKYTYISKIAYYLFKKDCATLSSEEMHFLHEQYCNQYQMRLPETEILGQLQQAQILSYNGQSYRFRFKFCYYYFVAKYFQENTAGTTDALRRELLDIADRVSFDDYTHILIFYIYLTNDRFVIDHIISNARKIYSNVQPANLDTDVRFVNTLLTGPPAKLSLPSLDIQANREEYRQRQDEDEQQEVASYGAWGKVVYEDALDDVAKINIALKNLRIMGQVLRNFPGVLRGELKLELTAECYLLGLRIVGALLALARSNLDELRTYFAGMIRIREGVESEEDLSKSADEALIWVTRGIAYGIIKRISYAVGLEDLQLTYDGVLNVHGNLPSIRLVDLSIRLDHFRNPSERDIRDLDDVLHENPFSHNLLRQLVADYLYLYCTDMRTMQRLGSLLDINVASAAFLANKKTPALNPAK